MLNRNKRAHGDMPSSGNGRVYKKGVRPGSAEAGAARAAQAAQAQAAENAAPAGQAMPAESTAPTENTTLNGHHIGGTGRPRSGAPKPATAGVAPAAGKPSRFTQKQIRNSVLIGSLIVVLILALVLAALLPGCLQNEAVSSSSPGSMSLFSSSSFVDDSYDQNELEIPVGKYADTILPETDDAGTKYVEETLFLGDSNTARMLLFRDVTGVTMSNGIGIESMGITSVLGLKCVRFSGMADCTMPTAVSIMQPRRIVINFGTNNAGMNVDSFISYYKKACEAIHDAYPAADIIVASVFPVSKGTTYGSVSQKGIDEFNLALVEMAQDEGYKFLNWSEAIKGADGYCKSGRMLGDGVHLNGTAMEEIFEYFRTHSYITEDTRPKPLKAIPTRLPTPEGLFPKPVSSATGSSSDTESSSSSSSSSQAPASSQEVSVAPSVPETSSQTSSSSSETSSEAPVDSVSVDENTPPANDGAGDG